VTHGRNCPTSAGWTGGGAGDDERGVVAWPLPGPGTGWGYAYAEVVVPAATEAVLLIAPTTASGLVERQEVFELWTRGDSTVQDR